MVKIRSQNRNQREWEKVMGDHTTQSLTNPTPPRGNLHTPQQCNLLNEVYDDIDYFGSYETKEFYM